MLRFAAIADVQYGDLDDTIGRHYRQSLEKLIAAAGEFASEKVLFAMNFGDALQAEWSNALAIKEIFDVSEKHGGIHWRHVLGNHDFVIPDDKKKDLYGLFNLKKPGYYDFAVVDPDDPANKWRFVVLNGNEISVYASENDEERQAAQEERQKHALANGSLPNNYGSVSKRQLQWLDERLKYAGEESENVLVCSHFPLYASSKSLHSPRTKLASLVDVGIYYSDLGVSTWNGREILEILDKHTCVKGYLAGHLHEGSYGERKNVAHVTFKGVVETDTNAYSFIELSKDSIKVDGRQEQPSYEFRFATEQN